MSTNPQKKTNTMTVKKESDDFDLAGGKNAILVTCPICQAIDEFSSDLVRGHEGEIMTLQCNECGHVKHYRITQERELVG
jgi:RNase P subunit RPR2